MKKLLFLILLTTQISLLFCQKTIYHSKEEEEEILNAKTKQVGQFIRRFNHDEDEKGNRLNNDDKKYRNTKYRKDFIAHLFDKQSTTISVGLRNEFIDQVTNKNKPKFLDFHGGEWYAEVAADFTHFGKTVNILLFLKLEKENGGHKWVLSNVYYSYFNSFFDKKPTENTPFLHPLSHELGFMNMRKAFENVDIIEYFGEKEYKPDYLTLFFYEIKKSNLKFETVTNVKFHFLQIDNWYFELQDFNRYDHNSGWLISNLMKITDEDKKQFINLIHHE